MAPNAQQLLDDLAALEGSAPAKSPCGCGGTDAVAASDLGADLDAALQALGGEGGGDLALDFEESDDLLFSDFEGQESNVNLDDLVFLAERYPGLKITISF